MLLYCLSLLLFCWLLCPPIEYWERFSSPITQLLTCRVLNTVNILTMILTGFWTFFPFHALTLLVGKQEGHPAIEITHQQSSRVLWWTDLSWNDHWKIGILCLPFSPLWRLLSRWTWVNQNVSILDFIGAKDGDGGDSWSYLVRMSPPTNQHRVSLTGRMSFLSPNRQCRSTEGNGLFNSTLLQFTVKPTLFECTLFREFRDLDATLQKQRVANVLLLLS